MTPILILAAGQSSRMRGRDKLMEPIDGEPLLVRQTRRALATGNPVFVALPGPEHPRYAALRDLQIVCLAVPESSEGMGGTMRGAVARLPECRDFMLLLGDLPDIETADMERVLASRAEAPKALIYRGATKDGLHGHPIVFDASLRPEFAKLSGDSGGEPIVKPLKARTHLVPLDGDKARLDLDTPEDWDAWRLRQNQN